MTEDVKNRAASQNPLVYTIVRSSCRFGFKTFFRLKIMGLENIPDGTVLLGSNHCSNFDPVLVGCSFPRPIHYLAKEELFKPLLLGPLITALGAHPVSREDSQKAGAVLKFMVSLIKEGRSLLLFPEGTRSQDGTLLPLEGGVAFLSVKTGVPVVPVWISGTHKAFPRGASFPRFVPLSVSFGTPIYPDCASPRESRENIMAALEKSLLEMAGV